MSQANICAKIFEKNCLHILEHIKHCSLDDLSKDTIGRQLLDVRRLHDGNTYYPDISKREGIKWWCKLNAAYFNVLFIGH